ncbi:MAG: PA2169 family four-helix-bundle protein [Burkholderiales bacterium]|nr:PA2169 family four-helix-bundle protein [Phycisphaerae bacterium]
MCLVVESGSRVVPNKKVVPKDRKQDVMAVLHAPNVISTLNELTQICIDGEKGFAAAAEVVEDMALKEELNGFSAQRRRFTSELQSIVQSQGEQPAKSGDPSAAIHRAWLEVRALFTGKDRYAVLAECERGEDAALATYEKALNASLAAPAADVIRAQYLMIKHAHDRVKSLRDAAKAEKDTGR